MFAFYEKPIDNVKEHQVCSQIAVYVLMGNKIEMTPNVCITRNALALERAC